MYRSSVNKSLVLKCNLFKKIRKIFLLGSISKFYINYIQKKYLKYLINEEIDPLLGALRIAKKNFPLEVLINDKKSH